MRTVLIALVAAGATVAACQGASATTVPTSKFATANSTFVNSAPMHLASAVKVVGAADATGEVPVLLSDGSSFSVPASSVTRVLHPDTTGIAMRRTSTGMEPDITVNGPCGSSNIYVHEKSNGHPVKMTTGFTIRKPLPPAVSYKWRAEIDRYNGGYDYSYSASGGLAFRYSWAGGHSSDANYPSGYYEAFVTYGFAQLANGLVCVSGDPYAALTYL
ncbi:hypothetical protein [Fodinicola feengrottensis]|uniref:hypothetical protein n=1 Tax=Fodinicola feengrottensis TaxID=435914 RepID=UPI0013D191D2|nr:hypothetical protein [Fodinicola feengrottensis]